MMAERIIKRSKRSSTLRSGALPGREMLVVGVEVMRSRRALRVRDAYAREGGARGVWPSTHIASRWKLQKVERL